VLLIIVKIKHLHNLESPWKWTFYAINHRTTSIKFIFTLYPNIIVHKFVFISIQKKDLRKKQNLHVVCSINHNEARNAIIISTNIMAPPSLAARIMTIHPVPATTSNKPAKMKRHHILSCYSDPLLTLPWSRLHLHQ
jgi:hypothetical protein